MKPEKINKRINFLASFFSQISAVKSEIGQRQPERIHPKRLKK